MLFEKTDGKNEDSMVPDMKESKFWEEEPLAEFYNAEPSPESESLLAKFWSPSYWM